VWRGTTGALRDPSHLSAVARLGAADGEEWPAQSVTRMVSVVERLLVLARVERGSDGVIRLRPAPGGYLISTLELPDAMRLLGGRQRPRLLIGAGAVMLGVVAAVVGLALLLVGFG
jgi:hypothetical protein